MKINKSIIIGSIILGLFGIALILVHYCSVLENIGVSLLAGAIVSIVSSALYYGYERQNILVKINSMIRDLYVDLTVIRFITGDIISKIPTTSQLSSLHFHKQTLIGEEIVVLLNEYHEGVFFGFITDGIADKIVTGFEAFIHDIRGIKFNLSKLESLALDIDNAYLQIELEKVKGQKVSEEKLILLEKKKSIVCEQASKIYEYEL